MPGIDFRHFQPRIGGFHKAGKRVLITAHGNSLRALVKHLDGLGEQEVVDLNIPTGVPRVYELDTDFRPRTSRYLGDQADIARREAEVKAQASGKAPSGSKSSTT